MRSEKSVVVQGKSVELALQKAADELGVAKDRLSYEMLSQSNAGFLSFLGGKKVELKAWVVGGGRQQRPARRERAEENNEEQNNINREPLTSEELDSLVKDLREFCSGVSGFIVGRSDIAVAANLEGEKLTLNIEDEEIAEQLTKNSRLAESMEHILRKKPRYLRRELPFRIFVDANGIRVNRETELVEMARDLSAKVAENQKPIVLNYKSSYDRKIIHMALDRDERVYTKSIGSGANRKLMILPIKDEQPTA